MNPKHRTQNPELTTENRRLRTKTTELITSNSESLTMNSLMERAKIIIYQPDEQSSKLKIQIEDETVWLSQIQLVELFKSTKQNISLHINNIFREGELHPDSNVKECLTIQTNFRIHISFNNACRN